MKKTVKIATLITLGLFICGTAFGQVQETKTYKDGSVYTGQFNGKGKKQGSGRMVWSNGNQYEGEWKNDKPNGEGVFTYANGEGVKIWPNGDRYEGSFSMGHLSGQGTCRFHDGAVYTGSWNNDMYNGQGRYVGTDGTVFEGNFRAGKLQ